MYGSNKVEAITNGHTLYILANTYIYSENLYIYNNHLDRTYITVTRYNHPYTTIPNHTARIPPINPPIDHQKRSKPPYIGGYTAFP